MADTIVVLNEGGIAQTGAPLDIYKNPNSAFVASFIGSPEINLIHVKTAQKGAKYVLANEGTKLPLAKPVSLDEGIEVKYGIRPQHIQLVDKGISATIIVVEPTGEDQDIVVQAFGSDISVVVHGFRDLKPGETVSLKIDPAKALLFDASSGTRL